MKLFKPLFIPTPDYSGVSFHHSKGWNSYQRRYIDRLHFHDFAEETRLTVEVEEGILKQCRWLTDYLYGNTDALARVREAGTPSDKVNGTKMMLAIGRVAQAKVRKDWASYTDAILHLNTLYIYALEFRYGRECGYTDDAVVIGSNKYGWRKQKCNPDGNFIPPKARRYGRYQKTDK
tara:strand:+ start:320 stop:850 length:531 start_codon:yes stop_codon:yes gene_type:complete